MKGILFSLAILVTASAAFAQNTQPAQTMGGWNSMSAYNQLYNPSKETTVHGVITGIAQVKPETDMTAGETMTVKTLHGSTSVDLGPAWFIDHQREQLHTGDTVSVTGARVRMNNRSFLMARKVVKGNHVMYVREVTGFPMWVAVREHADTNGPVTMALNLTGKANPNEADSDVGPVAVAPPPPPPTTTGTTATNSNGTSTSTSSTPATTAQGTVENITSAVNPQTGQTDEILVVNTPNGPVSVDVGPQWYISQQPVAFTQGSNLYFSGYPYTGNPYTVLPNGLGSNIILANGLNWGNQYMILRNGPFTDWNTWYPGTLP